NDGPFDTIRNCRDANEEETLRPFLRSLLGEDAAPVPELETLIAAHQSAWATLEAACKVTDDAEFDTPEYAAADEAQSKASDATSEAIWNIVEHPYSSFDELKRGMGYLVQHHRTTGDGNPGEWFEGLVDHLVGGAND